MRAIVTTLTGLVLLAFASPTPAQEYLWCFNADDVWAEVSGTTVVIHHDATVYNCCPDPFEYQVHLEGGVISVREIEVLSTPCDCLCCFRLSAEIENVPPGEYTLEFCWYDYEVWDWVVLVLEVVVPESRAEGDLAIGTIRSSGCIDAASVPDPGIPPEEVFTETWASIKALYR
ncbi:MAG: hypothetical protein KAY32_00025 [Candidatus Eisenbacteria sp.]|nr:hypothetical protein [Candidatus Eisenbacteria bacterium]